jgi:hypothetical protein
LSAYDGDTTMRKQGADEPVTPRTDRPSALLDGDPKPINKRHPNRRDRRHCNGNSPARSTPALTNDPRPCLPRPLQT